MFKITQDVDYNDRPVDRYMLECYVYSKDHHTNKLLYTLCNLDKAKLARYLEGEGVNAMVVLENTNKPVIITN